MTTGFMRALSLALLCAGFAVASAAGAADVSVMGLFNGKAVLVINNGKPRTLNVGETADGVKLISATSETAIVEFEGKRQSLGMGSGTRMGGGSASSGSGAGRAVLTADSRGHFFANGSINGNSVRFLVDTGASTLAISSGEAKRLGINYLNGTRGRANTANGVATAYLVKVDNVRVGDITLHNVDCAVLDGGGLSEALLGMSFLNRTQMQRDGDTLTLTRRY